MAAAHDELWPFSEAVERRPPWNEDEADRMAIEDGLGHLTEAHWKIINTLREHFVRYGALPPMRYACLANDMDPHCVEKLFHGGREVWHIAGLPDPGEEAKTYMT